MENNAQLASETAVGGEQPQVQLPELTITDLTNLRSIVDAAVRRGAFGAAEMSAIGQTFDNLNTFLNSVAPKKTEETASE